MIGNRRLETAGKNDGYGLMNSIMRVELISRNILLILKKFYSIPLY